MHKKKTAASRIPPTPLHHTLNIKEKRRGSDDIHMYSYSSIQLTSDSQWIQQDRQKAMDGIWYCYMVRCH